MSGCMSPVQPSPAQCSSVQFDGMQNQDPPRRCSTRQLPDRQNRDKIETRGGGGVRMRADRVDNSWARPDPDGRPFYSFFKLSFASRHSLFFRFVLVPAHFRAHLHLEYQPDIPLPPVPLTQPPHPRRLRVSGSPARHEVLDAERGRERGTIVHVTLRQEPAGQDTYSPTHFTHTIVEEFWAPCPGSGSDRGRLGTENVASCMPRRASRAGKGGRRKNKKFGETKSGSQSDAMVSIRQVWVSIWDTVD